MSLSRRRAAAERTLPGGHAMCAKTCIIVQVGDGFWEKVHYSAVFEGGKNTENALSAEIAETWRADFRESRD
jgi:hypothetical protein